MEGSIAVIVAFIGAVASCAVAVITARVSSRQQEVKLREELKLDYSVETVLVHLLENPNYVGRSFKKIKYHIRGFASDDELRMALLRAGAVVIREREGDEFWGLLNRNEEAVR